MLKKSAIWINRVLWALMFLALILVASYVSVGRYYINYVEEYQKPLLTRFNQFTNLPLSIDRLYGRWSQLSPVLTMERLELYAPDDPQQSVLTINKLSFQLDPLGSLLQGSLKIKRLLIDGVECALEETSPGQWQLKGYPMPSGGTTNFDNLVDLVLSVDGAELLGADITINFAKGSDALLAVKEISFKRSDDFRRFRVEANFDQSEKPVLGIIESQGDPRELEDFSAKAYLIFNDVDFSAQLPAMGALGIDLEDARIDGQLWVDWKPQTVIEMQGSITTPLLDIAALSGRPLDPLKDVSINFRAEKNATGNWEGWVPLLAMQWQGEAFKFEQLEVDVKNKQLEIAIPTLDLTQITRQLVAIDLLGDELKDTVKTLSLAGDLQQVSLNLSRNPTPRKTPRFILQANLDNVSVSPWKGAPGATGVNGYLEVSPTQGVVELDTTTFSMVFPLVYRKPLAFESAKGIVGWEITEDRVYVDSGPLYLTADHGPATALLDLDLPKKIGSDIPPEMTLTIGLLDTASSYRDKFIPYTLNKDFLNWMSGSVPKGRVIDGGFIYRGSLRKEDTQDRTVQLYLNVEGGTLDYHPEWPKLTDIRGMVEVDNADVRVNASSAKMYEMDVTGAYVTTTTLEEGGIWLTIDAKAAGESSDAIRLVNESALQKTVGDVFKQWQLKGKASADVSLGLPLADANRPSEIEVAVQLSETDVTIPEYRLQFSELNGPFNYSSEKGVYSEGLTAKLYNKPFEIGVGQDQEQSVLVDFSGRVDMLDVLDWSQQAALSFAHGETDMTAQVKVNKNGGSLFTVSSNLLGVDIGLPEPYTKSANDARDYWLKLPLGGEKPLLQMGMLDIAQLQLRLHQGQVESGLIMLDEKKNTRHEEGFLVVTGAVNNFILDEWQQVLTQYNEANQALIKASETDADPATTEASEVLSIKVRDLLVENFSGFDQQYQNSMVGLQRWQDAWWLKVSNDVMAGELFIADDTNAPLIAKLQRLKLPESSVSDDLSTSNFESLKDLNLDFSAQQLFLGDDLYGSLSFELRSQQDGLVFNQISGDLRGILIDKNNPATLEWLQTDNGEESRLYGQFAFADLGDVLEKWNYERMIESQEGNISLDLTWPGAPNQWSLVTSSGPLYLKVEEGRFLKASETASGTLKVVGIVNFTNIIRRLQLDFSDIYESGISYDRIEGEMILEDARLNIVEDLTVEAPSSRFSLRGNADLEAKELDMELIATLPVANNLPWIAALAGGLPTAAGVYVASKIFEDQFDRLSSAVYSIDGDWNDPQLKFEKVFDSGNKSKPATPVDVNDQPAVETKLEPEPEPEPEPELELAP